MGHYGTNTFPWDFEVICLAVGVNERIQQSPQRFHHPKLLGERLCGVKETAIRTREPRDEEGRTSQFFFRYEKSIFDVFPRWLWGECFNICSAAKSAPVPSQRTRHFDKQSRMAVLQCI